MDSSKKPLKTKWKILIIVVTLTFLYLIGFRIGIHPLPAPCVYSNTMNFQGQEIFVIGGCFSTRTVPLHISYSPKRCLKISSNSCSQPRIDTLNYCGESISNERTYQIGNSSSDLGRGPFLITGKLGKKPYFALGFVSLDWCKE